MTSHQIGEITLSLSTIVYFLWFIPQILLNYQRKSTRGLSLWMHGLLFVGYTADLLYGFGRHMQWQYRLVTVVGLMFLFVEHVQFFYYGCKRKAELYNFVGFTFFIALLLLYAVMNFTFFHHSKKYYDIAGFVSALCWMTYLLPQLIKNFKLKSTRGLSIGFVAFSVCLSFLDITSTVALRWDWPSMMSEGITLLKKSLLVFQMIYYKKGSSLN